MPNILEELLKIADLTWCECNRNNRNAFLELTEPDFKLYVLRLKESTQFSWPNFYFPSEMAHNSNWTSCIDEIEAMVHVIQFPSDKWMCNLFIKSIS